MNLRFWEKLLRAHGITVVSARETGIDAEGKVKDIEKALGTTIRMVADEPPSIGELSVREPGKQPPLAYVPREPTYF